MWFRSNRPHRFTDVDNPVDSRGQEIDSDPDVVWPDGSDAPVDRQSFLAELLAERFGLPARKSTPKESR